MTIIPRLTSAVLLVGVLVCATPVGADHDGNHHHGLTAPPSEPLPPLLRHDVPGFAEGLKTLPPFFRDTQVDLHLRTLYFNLQSDTTASEAWALGGWLEYKSGWLADVFRLGATGYTSQPLHAPEGRDGTLLLGPDQSALLVLGQAYGQLRYQEYALLTGYRQLVNQGYTNPHDDRMIPQTFEGATLGGALGPVDYFLGYLTAFKARDSDEFINMAARAGVAKHNRGQWLTSARLARVPGLDLYLANYLVPDVFNTAYLHAEYKVPLATRGVASSGSSSPTSAPRAITSSAGSRPGTWAPAPNSTGVGRRSSRRCRPRAPTRRCARPTAPGPATYT